jgi:acetyl/propionyl-CoA carboxylase alpha subunit
MSQNIANFWTNSTYEKKFTLAFNNELNTKFSMAVKFTSDTTFTFSLNGKEYLVRFALLDPANRVYQCEVNGHAVKLSYFRDAETGLFHAFLNDRVYEFQVEAPKYVKELSSGGSDSGDAKDAVAPMPGVVDKLNVKVGDVVKKGDALAVMIAMKMEYVIKSSRDGVVKSVNCAVGQNVKKAHKLVTLGE